MGGPLSSIVMALPAALLLLGLEGTPRVLNFEQRVEAQRAIERVYYSHQLGATRPFEEAVPDEALARKVATYLRQSLALEKYWHIPVTAQRLAGELARIGAGTQLPERLREIFDALGNDGFLIQETFVRQSLVDRLTRDAFAFDESIHAETRLRAEALRKGLTSGDLDLRARHPARIELVLALAGGPPGPPPAANRILLDPERFAKWRAMAPAQVGEIGPVIEEFDAFLIRAVLDERPGQVRIAIYAIGKKTWDDWWSEAREGLDPRRVVEVAGTAPLLDELRTRASIAVTAPTCGAEDTWAPTSTTDAPPGGAAVWSGLEMIVWEGGSGGRYIPAADIWAPTSMVNAPGQRFGHTMTWTGNVMTVWGGLGGSGYVDTGGRYNPLTDTWTPTSTTDAPDSRYFQTAVWTGADMIVWGGGYFDQDDVEFVGLQTGARYDPINDEWTPTPTAGAPAGSLGHNAVWTGAEMLIWGGHDGVLIYLDRGGRLDPSTGTWRPLSIAGAPAPRWLHQAVWTGSEMIVWGGSNDGVVSPYLPGPLVSGGRYNPATDRWRATSTTGAPEPRWEFSSVWAGKAMVVWGGASADRSNLLGTGARYDPVADAWEPTSTRDAPESRSGHAAVWTGSEMIVWGGWSGVPLVSGGRYSLDASSDADGDGYSICGGDCDDTVAAINPAGMEMPGNAIDENCDGIISCDPAAGWRNRGSFMHCVKRECAKISSSRTMTRGHCLAQAVRNAH